MGKPSIRGLLPLELDTDRNLGVGLRPLRGFDVVGAWLSPSHDGYVQPKAGFHIHPLPTCQPSCIRRVASLCFNSLEMLKSGWDMCSRQDTAKQISSELQARKMNTIGQSLSRRLKSTDLTIEKSRARMGQVTSNSRESM